MATSADVPPILQLRAAVASTRPAAVPPTVPWAAVVVPQLLVRDRGPAADAQLSRLPASPTDTNLINPPVVLAADLDRDRAAQVGAAVSGWADALGHGKSVAGQRADAVRVSTLASVWPAIPADRRRAVTNRAAAVALSAADPAAAATLARTALGTAACDGTTRADAADPAAIVVGPALDHRPFYFDGLSLAGLLAQVPADRQPAVAAALAHAHPTDRPVWPRQVIADAARPLPASVIDAVVAAAAAPVGEVTMPGPPGRGPVRRPVSVPWVPWFANPDQPAAVARLADALVPASATPPVGPPAPTTRPVDVAALVAVADAQALLGNASRRPPGVTYNPATTSFTPRAPRPTPASKLAPDPVRFPQAAAPTPAERTTNPEARP